MGFLNKRVSLSKTVFAICTPLLILLIASFIYVAFFSPDAENARHGVPETGWGALIVGIMIIPPIIVLFVIDLIAAIAIFRNRKRNN